MPIGILNNIASLSAENQLSITNSNLQSVLLQLSSGSAHQQRRRRCRWTGDRQRIASQHQRPHPIRQQRQQRCGRVASCRRRACPGDHPAEPRRHPGDGILYGYRVRLPTHGTSKPEFSQITGRKSTGSAQNTTYNGAAVFGGGQQNNDQLTTAVTTCRRQPRPQSAAISP